MVVNGGLRTPTFVVHEVVAPVDDIFVEGILHKWAGVRCAKKPCEIRFVLCEEEDRIGTRRSRTGNEQDALERRVLSFESVEVQAANAGLRLVILIRTTPRPHIAEP